MQTFSLDIETSGLDYFKDRILCIGVFAPEIGYRVFRTTLEFKVWNHPSSYRFICHNGAFDVSFMRHHGCDIRSQFIYDTQTISTILVPTPPIAPGQKGPFGLENLNIVLLGGATYKEDRTRMSELSWESLISYNEKDCRITYELANVLSRMPAKDWAFVESWVMPATKLLMDMSYNGIAVDKDRLLEIKAETEEKLNETKSQLEEITQEARQVFDQTARAALRESYDQLSARALVKAVNKEKCRRRYSALFSRAQEKIEPFNFNSNSQLKWLLKDFYGLDLFNQRSEKETTDEAMLKEHASSSPICSLLLRYRELQKMVSTSIPALVDHAAADSRIHPRFTIGGTRTGRLSSSKPNIQQVPKGPLRTCLKASEGYSFLIADYAQIEVRILAELADERELIKGFREGVDCYSIIAKRLLRLDCDVGEIKKSYPKERDVSKTAGLSIFYGTGAAKLREVLGKELGVERSLDEARDFIDSYRDGFPAIKRFKAELERSLADQGKLYGLLGRPVYIENNADLYMKALNTVVQGSASDLVVYAYTKIVDAFPFVRPILIVHDEIVLEIPDEKISEELLQTIEALATSRLEEELHLKVPLTIESRVAKEWMKP